MSLILIDSLHVQFLFKFFVYNFSIFSFVFIILKNLLNKGIGFISLFISIISIERRRTDLGIVISYIFTSIKQLL